MTEEKRNRLIAAVTVNVILLIAILAVVCIFQILEMVKYNNLKLDIQERASYLYDETNKLNDALEYYKSDEGLLDKAYEFGFVFGK